MNKKNPDLFNYCLKCKNNCCYIGPVLVLPDEYFKIKLRVGEEVVEKIFRKELDYYVLDKKKGEACWFLDKKSSFCTIHDIKPIDCKVWPLYFGKSGNFDSISISSSCPISRNVLENRVEYSRMLLKLIPNHLRELFYRLTLDFGYKLTELK
jgi:Fe-S-cluster containining protein